MTKNRLRKTNNEASWYLISIPNKLINTRWDHEDEVNIQWEDIEN